MSQRHGPRFIRLLIANYRAMSMISCTNAAVVSAKKLTVDTVKKTYFFSFAVIGSINPSFINNNTKIFIVQAIVNRQ